MKKMHSLVLAFLLAAMFPAPAPANDSTAMLGAGGLVLVPNGQVRMLREDLSISPQEVVVRYEFLNQGEDDLETEVAFPLPDVDLSLLSEAGMAVSGDDPVNFVGFSVAVDGQPAGFFGHMKAFVGEEDVTPLLVASGIPVSRFDPRFHEALENVGGEDRDLLSEAGVVVWDEFGNVYPKWTMRTAYHWTQVFPAGRLVVVEHRYRPVLGLSFFSGYDLEVMDGGLEEGQEAWSIGKAYCMSAAQEETAREMLAAAPGEYAALSAATLQYILTTANNWAGAIGQFRMEILPGMPGDIVATCMDGLQDAGDSRLVFAARDFFPEKEVDVLFLTRLPE